MYGVTDKWKKSFSKFPIFYATTDKMAQMLLKFVNYVMLLDARIKSLIKVLVFLIKDASRLIQKASSVLIENRKFNLCYLAQFP